MVHLRGSGSGLPSSRLHRHGADRHPDRIAAAAGMVMGPGGYQFGEYWKLGLPLLIWFFIVSVACRAADLGLR